MSRRRLALGAAAVVAAAALGLAPTGSPAGQAGAAPQPHALAQAPAPASNTLPLHGYQLSEAQARTVNHAYGLLLGRCMARAGVVWPVPDLRQEPLAGDRRYGLSSLAEAREHGYAGRPVGAAERAALAANARPLSGREVAALKACARDPRVERLNRLSPSPDATQQVLYRAALRSADGRRVLAAWRDCLRRSGHEPDLDEDRVWLPVGVGSDPEQDRRMAVDDVACKQRVGLARRLHAVEARLQEQYVAEHRAELLIVRQRTRQLVAAASDVIADSERASSAPAGPPAPGGPG